ncbi:MAG: hypothetical protein CME38_07355 [Haliea sp.]|nr:hypothetical protein [Haliea sp.]|tara:strand:+ start:2750 stop:3280 length:531 start_codon:yes stop_codon:yes gene_type:complete
MQAAFFVLLGALVLGVLALAFWRGARAAILGAAVSVLLLTTLGAIGGLTGVLRAERPGPLHWQPLQKSAIEAAVARGERVFVDVYADWCQFCTANRIGVLERDPVYSALHDADVVRLQGDWTHSPPQLTAYLRGNGRGGVPFNKVYGPAAPQGILLPPVLTEELVLAALDAAAVQP